MSRNEKESRAAEMKKGAGASGTERRSKTSAMWIVANDRVQLNEGM